MQNTQNKTVAGIDQNVGALLCYLGNAVCSLGFVFSIFVISLDKTNKLVRFHAFQSILIWVLGIIMGVAAVVIIVLAGVVDGFIGLPLFSLLASLVLIVIAAFFFWQLIRATLSAYQGAIYKIPLIGSLADKWA